MKRLKTLLLFGVLLMVSGCASKHMAVIQDVSPDTYQPGSNDAVIVFLRPSSFGGAIQASLFDVTTKQTQFIGISSCNTKLPYRVSPGHHQFMVVSEAADFMDADLEAGKTYYTVVQARMGVWKARFSLSPVHREEALSDKMRQWQTDSQWIENTEASRAWANENMPDIESKRSEYYQKWMDKPASEQPKLLREDGV